jgi:hypothetical protein
VAEHEADREPQPIDEQAAWAAIVAGYGEEPTDPPGTKPFKSLDGLALRDGDRNRLEPAAEAEPESPEPPRSTRPENTPDEDKPVLGGSVTFAPGVGHGVLSGPRDFVAPDDSDLDDDAEGHFVPPEPPPLPETDVTAKFAWLGVIGGPVLMLVAVVLQWDLTWWLSTICIGGFLGGFATLVARMQHDDDDENDDPGHGAVV